MVDIAFCSSEDDLKTHFEHMTQLSQCSISDLMTSTGTFRRKEGGIIAKEVFLEVS